MSKSIKELSDGKAFEVRNVKCSEMPVTDRLSAEDFIAFTYGSNPVVRRARHSEPTEVESRARLCRLPDPEVVPPSSALRRVSFEIGGRAFQGFRRFLRLSFLAGIRLLGRGAGK